MDRCMGFVAVVGWEENGMERGSVGCCWMQMGQCYMDRTKGLVGRTRQNDLRKDVQDGQKTGDWRLHLQDVPRCWCPYWAPPTARYWEVGCEIGGAGAIVGEE